MGSPTEDAFRETALRYGFDTWFVRDDPSVGSMSEPPIAGYREGGPGFNFVPSSSAFESPADLRPSDWDLKLRSARAIYAPAYARHFRSLDRQQVAVFRRGDSAPRSRRRRRHDRRLDRHRRGRHGARATGRAAADFGKHGVDRLAGRRRLTARHRARGHRVRHPVPRRRLGRRPHRPRRDGKPPSPPARRRPSARSRSRAW